MPDTPTPPPPSTPPPPATPTPSPAPGGSGLEKQCLEAMKAIGKALGQMALYKVGHPAVAATIDSALSNLQSAIALTPKGELVVGVDAEKLIANGRVVGSTAQVPNSVLNLYNRYKLSSLSFRAGLEHGDVAALCELAAARADATITSDPKGYLAARGVTHVALSEAVYTKATKKVEEEAGAAGGDDDLDAQIGGISDALSSGSLEKTLMALVEKAVPDPVLRAKVIARVLKLLESDIARRVDEVVQPLRKEKKIVENDAARATHVISNMVEGVVVVDEKGKILMMNPTAEQIYGESLAQAAGKTITGKASDEFVVTLASEIETPNDRDVSKDVKTQGAEDTQRTLRASSALVKTEAGKVVGMVTALPDATKHRELQKVQRDFIAHVTHELRAPLSSIRAALEILDTDYRPNMVADEAKMLAAAIKNSDRLADMVNSILDFSKIESGQMTVHPRECGAAEIAKEAVDSLLPWAQKKKVTLSLVPPPALPPVAADAPRTVQVLVNLLSNALKFTPAGGRIDVALAPRAENGINYVELRVSDTGPGIPKAEQGRIFEKFVQIASGETHVGGTGLGLSIAKALVHLQKGRMWIDSDVGKGAHFFFTLPVYIAGAADVPARAKPSAQPWWKSLFGLFKK
ncbi:MAG: PAS domain S-box protein [Elusimicrobia bacterium]|nr:PAS domain S-box protein [Elusimicrobiota bacterium]